MKCNILHKRVDSGVAEQHKDRRHEQGVFKRFALKTGFFGARHYTGTHPIA